MKKLMLLVVTLTILAGASIQAQDIAGTWQGTLQAGKGLRTVLKITKTNDGGWSAMFYSIDQGRTAWQYPPSPCRNRPSNFRCQQSTAATRESSAQTERLSSVHGSRTTHHILWTSSERQRRPSGKLTRPHTPCSSSWLIPTSNWSALDWVEQDAQWSFWLAWATPPTRSTNSHLS